MEEKKRKKERTGGIFPLGRARGGPVYFNLSFFFFVGSLLNFLVVLLFYSELGLLVWDVCRSGLSECD